MIYMRGIKAKDLAAIVDFIYHGEANVYQEDLDNFLALADELQLKGLTGTQSQKTEESNHLPEVQKPLKKIITKMEYTFPINNSSEIMNNSTSLDEFNSLVPVIDNKVILNSDTSTEDHQSLIGSMMERIIDPNYSWKCKHCGKLTKGSPTQMKRHIETHMEGLSYPCSMCDKVSRSSHALQAHMSSYHKH